MERNLAERHDILICFEHFVICPCHSPILSHAPFAFDLLTWKWTTEPMTKKKAKAKNERKRKWNEILRKTKRNGNEVLVVTSTCNLLGTCCLTVFWIFALEIRGFCHASFTLFAHFCFRLYSHFLFSPRFSLFWHGHNNVWNKKNEIFWKMEAR